MSKVCPIYLKLSRSSPSSSSSSSLILSSSSLFCSRLGSRIAFAKFNDSLVPEFRLDFKSTTNSLEITSCADRHLWNFSQRLDTSDECTTAQVPALWRPAEGGGVAVPGVSDGQVWSQQAHISQHCRHRRWCTIIDKYEVRTSRSFPLLIHKAQWYFQAG